MSTWTAEGAAELKLVLAQAKGGDTIALNAGNYDGLKLSNLSFAENLTITSADAAQPVTLGNVALVNVHGLTFSNLEIFAHGAVGGYGFSVSNSSDIQFDRLSVHGSLDGSPANDPGGLSIQKSSNITVTNSEFQQLSRAIVAGTVSNIQISGNNVHDMRTDGFDFAQVDHVTITDNVIRDFHKLPADHPDAIQFWTTGTSVASHDIVISGNVIALGSGDATQGIFLRDQSGKLPYQNVSISDNLILGTGYNGIRIIGANGVSLTNNSLVSNLGKLNATYILVEDAADVLSLGNDAASISFLRVTDLTQNGDTLNLAVTDHGVSAAEAWATIHPTSLGLVAGLVSASFALPVVTAVYDLAPSAPTSAWSVGESLYDMSFGWGYASY